MVKRTRRLPVLAGLSALLLAAAGASTGCYQHVTGARGIGTSNQTLYDEAPTDGPVSQALFGETEREKRRRQLEK